jgi:sugar (pentulose or hexulose) kinase
MSIKVTAVFDIGKTNKNFFLFDTHYHEVYREYTSFDPVEDEDGHPAEDLVSLQRWLREVFNRILADPQFNVTAINFSTYGASLVHLDEDGEVVTPLYNYTKSLDKKLKDTFFEAYGPEGDFTVRTGSTYYGMLNSGMQLYWIKITKPGIFKKIKYSLHLPQYISYIFTGIPLSEYTSIGCHTAMWDFQKQDYHHWIYDEGIHRLLPPIISTETSINMNYNGKRIKIGVGIHDSSAALLPYVRSERKKFILVSTGTWSIALNPFAEGPVSRKDIASDCVSFMRIAGQPVRSTRLFLGKEYDLQVAALAKYFKVSTEHHKTVPFDHDIFWEISTDIKPMFKWESFKTDTMPVETTIPYDCFEKAYCHLMIELVKLQVENIKLAMGGDVIKKLYVDGGFSDNDSYISLLTHYLQGMKLHTTSSSLGSALGAAIVISDSQLDSQFLKKNYSLKKHLPFISK